MNKQVGTCIVLALLATAATFLAVDLVVHPRRPSYPEPTEHLEVTVAEDSAMPPTIQFESTDGNQSMVKVRVQVGHLRMRQSADFHGDAEKKDAYVKAWIYVMLAAEVEKSLIEAEQKKNVRP